MRYRGFALGLFVFANMAFARIPALAAPAPQPLPQVGSCPSGYSSDSRYCTPGWSARYALLKANRNSSCPSGYTNDGAYCVANSPNTKTAIHRNGSCPNGYSSDGDFCMSGR